VGRDGCDLDAGLLDTGPGDPQACACKVPNRGAPETTRSPGDHFVAPRQVLRAKFLGLTSLTGSAPMTRDPSVTGKTRLFLPMLTGRMSDSPGSRQLPSLRSACTLAVITVGALSWSQPDVDSTDFWWHLASGRQIWELGGVPQVDPFSHTALGAPWINYEWLWGLLAWLAYRQHPDLVAWLNLALVASIFAMTAVTARRVSRSWLVAGVVTWLAAANFHWFSDVRPHLTTLFFTALLLATLDWRRAPWLWAPVMAAWANLHAGFVFGIGLLGLHLLFESGRWFRGRRAFPKAGWIGLVAAMLAVALNPWGFEIYSVPLHVIDPETPFRDLIEWHPLELRSLDPATYSGRFLWTLAIAAPALRQRSSFYVVLALVTVVMAFSARRFIELFAIAAAPAIALGLSPLWNALARSVPVLRTQRAHLAGIALGALLSVLLWQNVRFAPGPLFRWTRFEAHPSGAVAYLNALAEPPRRLFNFYNWGGLLAMYSRSTPTFIDGRAATVYNDTIARDYLRLWAAAPGWRQLIADYEIDAVLVPPDAPLASAVRRSNLPWRIAHADSRSVLFRPRAAGERAGGPALLEKLSRADAQLSRAYVANRRGKPQVAERALLEVIRQEPLQLEAYGDLMVIAARRGDTAAIQRWTDAALDVYPRRWNRIWAFAEHAWRVAGKPRESLEALERVRLGGPFIRRDVLEDLGARRRAPEE